MKNGIKAWIMKYSGMLFTIQALALISQQGFKRDHAVGVAGLLQYA